jgi:putative NADPH-quinone reductase
MAMQVLVVFCHPARDSYVGSILDALAARLEAGGHAVRVIDLYGEGFDPVLDREAWKAHRQGRSHEDPSLAAHISALRACEALVFVFPTWWYGLPAMLKGWLDRTWQPNVAFTLEGGVFQTHALKGIRRFAAISTHGSPGWFIEWIVGAPVWRQLMRGLGLQFASGLRTCWRPIYAVDGRSQADLAQARDRAVSDVAQFLDRGRP